MKSLLRKVCVVQFAKAPILGAVKTRMEGCLSQTQCLALHLKLVRATYSALHEGAWDYQLWLSGDENNGLIKELCQPEIPVIKFQKGQDLGHKMAHCFRSLLQEYDQVIIVGSDCPYLSVTDIQDVIEQGGDVPCSLIPALDGGYVLIALNSFSLSLFENINWGSSSVLSSTIEKLNVLGWDYLCLDAVSDIDHPSDLSLLLESSRAKTIFDRSELQLFHRSLGNSKKA